MSATVDVTRDDGTIGPVSLPADIFDRSLQVMLLGTLGILDWAACRLIDQGKTDDECRAAFDVALYGARKDRDGAIQS